jgi:4-hydroxythreonine-4-phosphate dehydrogenase
MTLALTMGDPAGIGPEITVKAWQALRAGGPDFVYLGDPASLSGVDIRIVSDLSTAAALFPHALPVWPIDLPHPSIAGQPDPHNAPAIIESIAAAVRLTCAGAASAVVTNPIAKAVLYEAGFAYPGHTEFLAHLTAAQHPVMMLAAPALRVVPVSIHVSLRQALALLSIDLIVDTARVTAAALSTQWGIAAPRLAIAGLNPHAGENGAMGDEEQLIIAPAIAALRDMGIDAWGPVVPDALFTDAARATYDVAICMYHDQALIPLKALDRENGVNVTLGLPIIRTSPDHGTAFDIAGRGIASPASLIAALRLAASLAAHRVQP